MSIAEMGNPDFRIRRSPVASGSGDTAASAEKKTPVKKPVQTSKKPVMTDKAQAKLGEREGATHGSKNTFDEADERSDEVKIYGVDY